MPQKAVEIRQLLFSTGERFPVLIENATGVPDFDVTVYVLTQLRARNLSTATIRVATRSIMFGLQALSLIGINLKETIRGGTMFTPAQLEDLIRHFSWSQYKVNLELDSKAKPVIKPKVVRFESVRMAAAKERSEERVDPKTASTRLLYFRDFFEWTVQGHIRNLSPSDPTYSRLKYELASALQAINARMPHVGAHGELDARQGLSIEAQKRFLEVTDPSSLSNPWKGEIAKVRNHLIIRVLLSLGLRKGELLGLKVGDIDFRTNRLTIHRRADDPDDPRLNQPNAKTAARVLELESELAHRLQRYVTTYRRSTAKAKKHPFLFVSIGAGDPLSISSVDKIFNDVKALDPFTFQGLCPHILRHTWNERFSELMDEHGVDETKEEAARSYAMGWRNGSGTAKTYTRRHIRRQANTASLAIQDKFTKL